MLFLIIHAIYANNFPLVSGESIIHSAKLKSFFDKSRVASAANIIIFLCCKGTKKITYKITFKMRNDALRFSDAFL